MRSIQDDYYSWMLSKIESGVITERYQRLLQKLHLTEYTYIRPLDENLGVYGIDLRYRYGYEEDIPQPIIAAELDIRPSSVLEMMVSLALRCEEFVMADSEKGNRTYIWFWDMVNSIGLLQYNDKRYRDSEVSQKIRDCLNREFEYNGRGGFFTILDTQEDIRNIDIWTAAMWYLDTIE